MAGRKWSNEFLRSKYGTQNVHVKLIPNCEFEGCDEASKFDNYETMKIPDTVLKQLPFPDLVVVRRLLQTNIFQHLLIWWKTDMMHIIYRHI